MKLRTRLILAFLLLSVLPLSAMTLYSYRSSQQAFQRAVEAEAGELAQEMGRRMESVVADLDQRFGRLNTLPYEMLLENEAREASDDSRVAGLFLSQLKSKLGNVAPLIESLEFQPMPTRPETPDPPVTIHISRALFSDNGEQREIESTHVIGDGNELVLVPGSVPDLDYELMGQVFDKSIKIVSTWGSEELRLTLEEVQTAMDESSAGIESHAASELFESAARQVAVSILTREDERPSRAGTESEAAPRFSLGREFKCDVQESGHTIGTVSATVDSEKILRSVLSEAKREQGEIPFAVGPDGRIFTPDPDDRSLLESELDGWLKGGGQLAKESRVDNWIVATRQTSPSETTFGIARPIGESMDELRQVAVNNLGFGLGMIAIAMLGIIPLSGRMTRDLSVLSEGAVALSEGRLDTRVPVRSGDEIGRLAQSFNRMGAALQENQQRLVQQERIRRELELCRQLQNEMLPPAASRLAFADVRAISIPAREVGGDFFNYFTLPNGDIAVLVGDVSGKGVAAAMLMANVQANLRAKLTVEQDLATLAEQLDLDVENNTPDSTYVTLFMGVLDPCSNTLRYVNAGHNPQYLVRHGATKAHRMPSTGRPLGLLSGGGYVERQTSITPGDWLFLFTDGLTEMTNPEGNEFGEQRLEAAVLAARDDGPGGMLRDVEESIRQFRGEAEPADDATMMVIRIESSESA